MTSLHTSRPQHTRMVTMRVGFVKEAGLRYPSDCQTILKKCDAFPSDYGDLESDTSGPAASRTRRKTRLGVTKIQPLVATPVETSVVILTFLQSTRLHRMGDRHYGHLDYT